MLTKLAVKAEISQIVLKTSFIVYFQFSAASAIQGALNKMIIIATRLDARRDPDPGSSFIMTSQPVSPSKDIERRIIKVLAINQFLRPALLCFLNSVKSAAISKTRTPQPGNMACS